MTRQQRAELLDRFLSGRMSNSEEQDFYIQVAVDSELRLELKAHRTIDAAIDKDRVFDPAETAPLEATIAGMIARPAYRRIDGPTAPHQPPGTVISRPLRWIVGMAIATLITGLSWVAVPVTTKQIPPPDMNGRIAAPSTSGRATPITERTATGVDDDSNREASQSLKRETSSSSRGPLSRETETRTDGGRKRAEATNARDHDMRRSDRNAATTREEHVTHDETPDAKANIEIRR